MNNVIDWEKFRGMALVETGLEGHPRADEAYALAWKTGHEGGKEEVLFHLRDIAKMILEAN